MIEEMVARINELYKKQKAGTLTPEERVEQAQLRSKYIENVRANMKSQLDSIKIQNPDGSLIDVKARHDERMKNGRN